MTVAITAKLLKQCSAQFVETILRLFIIAGNSLNFESQNHYLKELQHCIALTPFNLLSYKYFYLTVV